MEELAKTDWNFDAVPDAELVGCCYWEYARESALIRKTLLAYRKRPSCGGAELNDEIRNLWDDVGRIQSIGHASDAFVRGCCIKPDQIWQSEDQEKPDYRHPHAPPLTGSFPAPWQSLSEVERKFRAHIRTYVEEFEIVPIKVSDWSWAKEIARECQQTADKRREQRRAWERKYLSQDTQGNFSMKPDAPAPPEFTELRPRIRWASKETLMVDIAWECFTNDEIANYFRKWVKCARPKSVPGPDDKGRNKSRDWRVALERLGMMRLLHHFRLRDLPNAAPAAWMRYQKREWYKERKRAGGMFRSLFPFLAKSEHPLNWATKGGRSR